LTEKLGSATLWPGGGKWRKVSKKPNFVGEFFYSLDAKNRLAVPARFRESILPEKSLILARGLEGCLSLYPASSWEILQQKV
jgi:division/cell wall cluster transcriptional repressor MraZ